MSVSRLHVPAESARDGNDPLVITPETAGWTYVGLHVMSFSPGETRTVNTEKVETAVLPLSGGISIECDGETIDLAGRETVFSGVSDWAYIPVGSQLRLTSSRVSEIALCMAKATKRTRASHQMPESIPIEYRGSGNASRQIVNFMTPEAFPDAHRLMCVEVYTPDGNCSSYPPHRHDRSPDCSVALEEIYYFRIGRAGSQEYEPQGIGLHHTYTDEDDSTGPVVVRDGDAFLVPEGYHGPSVALPGYPMYYLNVLAGGTHRSLDSSDDAGHHWIRKSWSGQEIDRRIPLVAGGIAPA